MRTVTENRDGLDQWYKFDDRNFAYAEDHPYEPHSCFYDFGARFPMSFGDYSDELPSAFVESLHDLLN